MPTNLFTPVLNERTRAPHFFNGRLLTGEAMTEEQRAQRVARELLAQAVGDGVAYGLEVDSVPLVSTNERPVVSVRSGVAINRRGEILLLASDTQVQLVRPEDETTAPEKIFRACTPVKSSATYIADAGVYLLTLSSIQAGNGLAQLSGLGDTPAACNIKYIVDAVEIRLLELPVDETTLADVARLRNLVAYHCFGVDDLLDFATDPFGTTGDPHTLLDDLRGVTLTDCDVPLAILYWTASGGIRWIDLWAVRRRVTQTQTASPAVLDDTRLAAAEAMREQFRSHVRWILESSGLPLSTLRARDHVRWLPPAGWIPLASSSGAVGFGVDSFFFGKAWNRHANWTSPIYMEGGMLEALLRAATQYPPVDLEDAEMIWIYHVRENMRALHAAEIRQPYAVFANANLPFFGEPRFDRAHWNYSNLV